MALYGLAESLHIKHLRTFRFCLDLVERYRRLIQPAEAIASINAIPPMPTALPTLQVRIASVTGSLLDELLAPVDIVRSSGESCVRHEVDGEGGDVGRADPATDWQSSAQLLATRV